MFFLSVKAEEITYQNVITDTTTIEDDFKILEMDMSNYYLTDVYKDFERAYVIAMSEAYTNDKNIQTYFYIYCPLNKEITIESLTYKLNGKSNTYTNDKGQLDYIKNKGLYKYKGFIYDYVATAKLEITQIKFKYSTTADPDSGLKPMAILPPIGTTIKQITSKSDFKGTINHNLANNIFTCELNYNSTLIIEEYTACRIEIPPSKNFFSNWLEFWDYKEKNLFLHFYNFNFPDNIQPDSIEYAKFEYDYCHYQDDYINHFTYIEHKRTEIIRDRQEKEYEPRTKIFKSNNASQELEFEVFVLGNRIEKGEFGYITEFTVEQKEYFKYDCSILLDSTIQTQEFKITAQTDHNFELENIDFIELHYKKDGILYKCQIVNEPIGKEEDIGKPGVEKSIWQKFCDWFVKNFPQSLFICFGVLIGSLLLLWFLIFVVLPLPFKIIKEILK